jgi:hypothetical protein
LRYPYRGFTHPPNGLALLLLVLVIGLILVEQRARRRAIYR